jgi:hypothetical protein
MGDILMGESAYIKLVAASNQQTITLDEVVNLFKYYKEITGKTGQQVSWDYNAAAFPYELSEIKDDIWFYLKGTDPRNYKYIVVGVGKEETSNADEAQETQNYIQVVLPDGATHGDKGKANEFCKFLAKKLEGELHLFNKRIMYYYKRKL